MRIYISGPVTGQEDTAKNRFDIATNELKFLLAVLPTLEHADIINPFSANAEIFKNFDETPTHTDYMITSMAMLSVCDAIFMLKGWEKSKGCQEEHKYAQEHGYKIIYETRNKNG